jgi:hypothetical protein
MKKIFTLFSMVALSLSAMSQVTVTYRVDVTDYLAAGNTMNSNGIRIGGNFTDLGSTVANWTPSGADCAMTDLGSNIWTIDVTYPADSAGSTQLFKFVNGDWGTNEGSDPANTIVSGGCGVADPGGNVNRTLVIPATNSTVCFLWDNCTACATASISENEIVNVVVSPNPTSESTNFTFGSSVEASITLFDLAGKVVATKVETGNVINFNTAALNAGIYMYQVKVGSNVTTGKISKK